MKRPVVIAAVLLVSALIVAVLPFTATNYVLRLSTIAFMYIALASSWNIVGGFLGYPSFATAAFFGIGAYGSAILRTSFSLSLPVGWIAGAIAAAIFALVVGPAILRLRGHYFAVASLVLAAVLREIVNSATSITGGGMGLNIPATGMGDVDVQTRLYYVSMLATALLAVAIAAAIWHSRLGWAMRCIEQNEDASIVLGVNTLAAKVAGFAVSALLGGLVGAIYATWIGYIDPSDAFDDLLSIKPIVMAFIGGVGTIFGPVAGALIFLLLEELVWRNVLNFHAGILGIIIVVLLVFLPGGLGSLGRMLATLRSYARSGRMSADTGAAPSATSRVLPS
ncbi:MAG: branched-chain amino acid ABC transporter permease [Bradyrhizobiaceae bacterium]|nr:MAG: branched-chain amino acid ABC transporter permease [Bradyrhizobiaceae bacterium]